MLDMLCGSAEYNELPVRHNEDRVNAQLAAHVRWSPDLKTMDDPHTKANLLLQVPPPDPHTRPAQRPHAAQAGVLSRAERGGHIGRLPTVVVSPARAILMRKGPGTCGPPDAWDS